MGTRSHFVLACIGVIGFSIVSSVLFAHVMVLGWTLSAAIVAAFGDLMRVQNIFLCIPGILVGLTSSKAALRVSMTKAAAVATFGMLPVALLYAKAYWAYTIAINSEQWTAATLTLGVFWSLALGWAAITAVFSRLYDRV